MRQLSLFTIEPTAPAPRVVDLAIIRAHLRRTLSIARDADVLPWREAEAADWEKHFPELAALLPPDEGRDLTASFQAEMARLRTSPPLAP